MVLKQYTFLNADILICEDNVLNQEMTQCMLNQFGIEADIAENGEECIKLLEKKSYDMILMDIIMPVMDGITATKMIRSSDKDFKNAVIIALTSSDTTEDIENLMSAGMTAYMSKPVNMNVLYENLLKYIPSEKAVCSENNKTDSYKYEFSIDGINFEEGLARFGGNVERYNKTLLGFAKEYEELRTYDNVEELKRYLHTLKGVAGNLGITEVYLLAKSAETDLRNADRLDKLSEKTRQVCKNIHENVSLPETVIIKSSDGTANEYLEYIKKLREAILISNPSECEACIKKLAETRWIGIAEYNLDMLAQAIESYDFDAALSICKNW